MEHKDDILRHVSM